MSCNPMCVEWRRWSTTTVYPSTVLNNLEVNVDTSTTKLAERCNTLRQPMPRPDSLALCAIFLVLVFFNCLFLNNCLSWWMGMNLTLSFCFFHLSSETAFDINVFKLCSASSFVVAFPAQFQRVRSILLY